MDYEPGAWEEGQLVDAATIEGYKKDWARRGFPDVDLKRNKRNGGACLNESTRSSTPEHDMWTMMLTEVVKDISKTSREWHRPCHSCHADQPCGCIQQFTGKSSAHGQFRVSLAGHSDKWKHCPNYHTYRDCAIRWVKSSDCADVCDLLSLDVEWFRKHALEGTCE